MAAPDAVVVNTGNAPVGDRTGPNNEWL